MWRQESEVRWERKERGRKERKRIERERVRVESGLHAVFVSKT